MRRLEQYMPLVAGLLSGVGGSVSWVYGSNTTAAYVGPQMEIRRAKSISKTSDSILAHTTDAAGNDVIDKATSIAAAVLSVLLCATAAALDLAIRFQYEDRQDSDSESDKKGYEETIENLKIASYTVTGRLMALLKTLEEKSSWAEFAAQWLKEAKFVGLISANIVLAAIPIYGWVALILLYEEANMKQALSDAAEALKD